jgi:cytochrome c oxidase assembly protein subunit 15
MSIAATLSGLRTPSRRTVGWWLLIMAILVAAMVTVGGLTRLTGSGLSITEWKPVTGIIPPLTHDAWQMVFREYQQIPQYRLENRGMSLAQFQTIYWWEWSHRLLGRLLAIVFLLPSLVFAGTGAIGRKDWPRMILLFALGGLQGVVGWWMVKSGLETRVSVSQYRLAIHLGVALLLFGALLWAAFGYFRAAPVERRSREAQSEFSYALVGLVYVQLLLGALVAGLHAGLIYNTWPSMNGRVFPEGAFALQPWWSNFFENAGLAQFDHRLLAYIIAATVLAFWIAMRRTVAPPALRTSSSALLAVALLQIALGIVALLNQMPLVLAALHQGTAVALLAAALWNAFCVRARDDTFQKQIVIPAKSGTQMFEGTEGAP